MKKWLCVYLVTLVSFNSYGNEYLQNVLRIIAQFDEQAVAAPQHPRAKLNTVYGECVCNITCDRMWWKKEEHVRENTYKALLSVARRLDALDPSLYDSFCTELYDSFEQLPKDATSNKQTKTTLQQSDCSIQ